MRRMLDINNPVMKILTGIFDLMMLSVLWAVFSLPVLTMGAASAAMYKTAYSYVRKGEEYLWKTFWTAFKSNLKRSTLAWLVVLAVLGLLVLDAAVFRGMLIRNEAFGWVYYVVLVLTVLALTWTVYLSAYSARFNGTVREVLHFSFLLFRLHPLKTLLVAGEVLVGILTALSFPALLILIPAAVYWGASFPIDWVFLQHLQPADRERMEKENES